MTKVVSIQKRLEDAHRGYAYELLQLQMAVEDQKLGSQPSIIEITKLIQLYMIGVEVLESISDPRFVYFHNKIHALMLKKHIVKKLHESSGNQPAYSISAINKAELKQKKDEHEINFYFNQGQIDIKKVKEMLNIAQNKQIIVEGKIKTDIKRQQDRLEQRIKQRKMKSQAGSVRKFKTTSEKQMFSPANHNNKQLRYYQKDPRMQYFQMANDKYMENLPKYKTRTNSGSLQKIFFDRKYGAKKGNTGSGEKIDQNDAI